MSHLIPLKKSIGLPRIIIYVGSFITILVYSLMITYPVHAADSGWMAGNIISDNVFTNSSSMGVDQIQAFLESKVPNCDTNGTQPSEFGGGTRAQWAANESLHPINGASYPPFTCLKDYTENDLSAAQIIYDVSQKYEINPQALLVLLQKEQGLVTDTWPLANQYKTAVGYGCPDTAECDSKYFGFTNQVTNAAKDWHYAMTPNSGFSSGYILNADNYIQYNPETSCGGSTVYIENRATWALYTYTPYQPNPAALESPMGGTVDCGAYGNLNFYRYFTSWFGSTQGVYIYSMKYDTSSDTTGESTKIGFGLSKKPTSDVTLSFYVNSPSNAKLVGPSTIKITRDSWNQPDKNIITAVGLNNPNLDGNFEYKLKLSSRPSSSDIRYRSLGSNSIEVSLLQQSTLATSDVYRLYSSILNQYTFTASATEKSTLISEGWTYQEPPFSYCQSGEKTIVRMSDGLDNRLVVQNSPEQKQLTKDGFYIEKLVFSTSAQGQIPVYWRYDETNNNSIYTTSLTEGLDTGFTDKGIVFYTCESTNKPIYRLLKPGGSHFYTYNPKERDKAIYTLGYAYEGLGFYTCSNGTKPIYRLLKESNGIRFYTASTTERDKAINKLGYKYEGVGLSLCSDTAREVYRLYNVKTGFRFYTISAGERDRAVSLHGYTYEGIGFKVE